jgi:hypothetical protein
MLDSQEKVKKDKTEDKENEQNGKMGVYPGRCDDVMSCDTENEKKNITTHHNIITTYIYPPLRNRENIRDKPQSEQITDKPTDKGEDSTHWQKVEKDIIDTIKNPPFTRRIYRFELISFLEQREYKAKDIEKVLNKLIEQGVVIQYPDESLDLNFSKIQGDG